MGAVTVGLRPAGPHSPGDALIGPDLDCVLPDGPAAAGAARARARAWLRGRGLGSITEDVMADVILAVSELAANACEHGLPPVRLRLAAVPRARGWSLTCEVSDAGPAVQRPARAAGPGGDPGAERGRGLGIVAALVTVSGVSCAPGGSIAWFRLDLPAGTAGAAAAA